MFPQPASISRAGIITIHRIVGEFMCWSQNTAAGSADVPIGRSVQGFAVYLHKLTSADTFTITTDTVPFMMDQVSQDDQAFMFQRCYGANILDDAGLDFQQATQSNQHATRKGDGGSHFDIVVKRRVDLSQYAVATQFAFIAGTAANHRVFLKARMLYTATGALG